MERKKGRLEVLQEGLATQLAEFKTDMIDKDLKKVAKSGSSLGQIKTAEQYSRDRDLSLRSLLTVPRPKPLHCQYHYMLEELELCLKPTFTSKNLPILLHQFFLDRLQQLVQLKHILLLRWARFSIGRPKLTEALIEKFKKRIEYVLLEYNDTLNRSKRLSVSCDQLLVKKLPTSAVPASSLIESEDVYVFLRWLIFHQHTIKKATAFTSSLQWFPLLHEATFARAIHPSPPPKDKRDSADPKALPQSKHISDTKKWMNSKQSMISIMTQSHRPPTSIGGVPSTPGGIDPADLSGGDDPSEARGEMCLPLNQTDMRKNKRLLQELMQAYNIVGPTTFPGVAEEQQFCYQVTHKFQSHFQHQETCSTFHTYDKPPEGSEDHGKKARSKLVFKKPSNWIPFVPAQAIPDPVQIKAISQIRQEVPKIDPLLLLKSQCTHLHQLQRVEYALRQHSVMVRHPSPLNALSVTSHKTPHDTLLVWKCIYSGIDSRNPITEEKVGDSESSSSELAMSEALKVISSKGGRKVSAKAHKVPKDSFMGFILLRHLKIRDLQAKCRSILNYFRSVERTLTINTAGLSLQHDSKQKSNRSSGLLDHSHLFQTPADFKINEMEFMNYMEVENHDDFYEFEMDGSVRVWDQRGTEIMYDTALEDLNTLEEELLTVASYYLRRNALKNKKWLSGEEHNDGEECGGISGDIVGDEEDEQEGEELKQLSQFHVDRFAILLDLWTSEARYLQTKIKVLNCYLEAYQHTLHSSQRANLHQAVITIIKSRPRYDTEALYFTDTYNKEVCCLDLLSQLLLSIINSQMQEERDYNKLVCNHSLPDDPMKPNLDTSKLPFGLPLPLISEQLVSLTGDRPLYVHSYLMEFSESLCVLGNIPGAIRWTMSEICTNLNTYTPADVVTLQCKLLELALVEWETRPKIGSSYSPEVNKQVFRDDCVEDPTVIVDLCQSHVIARTMDSGTRNPAEVKSNLVRTWTDILQLMSLRHHLIITCSETEFLTHVYKNQLRVLSAEECHAHLRCTAFNMSVRLPTDKDLDYFITHAREESRGVNPRLDRYTPVNLRLAVQELDEKDVGVFSFKTRDSIQKILMGSGMECLKATLHSEVVHRNALVMATQHNALIIRKTHRTIPAPKASDTPRPRSDHAAGAGAGDTPAISISPIGRRGSISPNYFKELRSSIISLQQEKVPVRDYMLTQFSRQPSNNVGSKKEQDIVKCGLISEFCSNFSLVISIYSLRHQTIRCYTNIIRLLEKFPATRQAFFTLGEPLDYDTVFPQTLLNAETTSNGGGVGRPTRRDSRLHRGRPHQLVTLDGKTLMNLWYIPHFTEVLGMFEELPVQERCYNMTLVLRLAASLDRLLQYMCAYVQLGSGPEKSHDPLSTGEGLKGAWGGTEGVGSELLHLQSEISRLKNPSDPKEVGDYLNHRCQLMFYKHDITIRHLLKGMLLSTDNTQQLQILESVSIPSILQLSHLSLNPLSFTHPSNVHYPCYSYLPRPLNTLQSKACHITPWRTFFSRQGLFPTVLEHPIDTGYFIYTSLACLGKEVQKLAHGEFIGLSLLLEDVLQDSELELTPSSPLHTDHNISHKRSFIESRRPYGSAGSGQDQLSTHGTVSKSPSSIVKREGMNLASPGSRPSSSKHRLSPPPQSSGGTLAGLLTHIPPLEGSQYLVKFLLVTSQLEQVKVEWGLKVLNCHAVNNQRLMKDLEEMYREKVVLRAKRILLKQISRDLARKQAEEETNETISMMTFATEVSEPFTEQVTPEHPSQPCLNEFRLRETQLSCLMDLLEQALIADTTKHLSKLHHLLLNERERDDSTLPLDLWKSNSMHFKEMMGLPRSHVVEDFTTKFQSHMTLMEEDQEQMEGAEMPEGEGLGQESRELSANMVCISMDDLKECVLLLSSGVLAREKECYQLYASYYESLLRSQYNQLYQKDQEIEHLQSLVETIEEQAKTKSLCFVGEHTQNLIMEITALRTKLAQFHQSYARNLEEARKKAIMEYAQLVNELFSATLTVKNKFEGYRGQLYGDMTRCVYDVRQSVAESVEKLKVKLGVKEREIEPKTGQSTPSVSKAEGIRAIQNENAELNKMIVRMRTVNNWNRHKSGVAYNTELCSMRTKLNQQQMQFWALKMNSEEEIKSLNQQVQVVQKNLEKVERDYEVVKQKLIDEKQKRHSTKPSAKKNTYLTKNEKSYATKMDFLKSELEEKERQMKALEGEKERSLRHSKVEKSQAVKMMRGIKHQLSHERNLKLDAFHHVDNLQQQVHLFEQQVVQASPRPPMSLYHLASNSASNTPQLPSSVYAPRHSLQHLRHTSASASHIPPPTSVHAPPNSNTLHALHYASASTSQIPPPASVHGGTVSSQQGSAGISNTHPTTATSIGSDTTQTAPLYSTSQSRVTRPRSTQSARLPRNSDEHIDLGQEILALKLI